MLMGGAFSAGGPGKGMHSRLYLRVLNQYQEIQSFSAFNSFFNHTELFGIYGNTGSDFVAKVVDLAAKELRLLPRDLDSSLLTCQLLFVNSASQLQLNRANEATISACFKSCTPAHKWLSSRFFF